MNIPLPETEIGPGKWKTVFFICWGAFFGFCSPHFGDRTLELVLLSGRSALVLLGFISVYEPGLSPNFRARLFVLANVGLAGFFYLYATAEEQANNRVMGVWFPLLLIGGALLIFLIDWFRLTRRKKTQ